MTVETATVSSLVPPKKRDFSDYPNLSPAMDVHQSPPTPDNSAEDLSVISCKSEPIKSGFMITDILSPPSSGLRLEQFAAAHHLGRVPSPHGTASSDAGSYKENDISDDGEGNLGFLLYIFNNCTLPARFRIFIPVDYFPLFK